MEHELPVHPQNGHRSNIKGQVKITMLFILQFTLSSVTSSEVQKTLSNIRLDTFQQ